MEPAKGSWTLKQSRILTALLNLMSMGGLCLSVGEDMESEPYSEGMSTCRLNQWIFLGKKNSCESSPDIDKRSNGFCHYFFYGVDGGTVLKFFSLTAVACYAPQSHCKPFANQVSLVSLAHSYRISLEPESNFVRGVLRPVFRLFILCKMVSMAGLSWILLSLGQAVCLASQSQTFALTYSSFVALQLTLSQNPLNPHKSELKPSP